MSQSFTVDLPAQDKNNFYLFYLIQNAKNYSTEVASSLKLLCVM